MGTSSATRSAATAQRLARTAGSAGTRRRARYPSSRRRRRAVEVSRASQAHHTPHAGRPQIDPVTQVRAENTAPTSTEAAASLSQKNERVRGHRYRRLPASATPPAQYRATVAMGGGM